MATDRRRDERGQVTPLAAVALALVVLMLPVLGAAGRAMSDRAQARTAADAAALAGAAEGEAAARSLAVANGGELRSYETDRGEVVVEVEVGGVRAFSRARSTEVADGGGVGAGVGDQGEGPRAGLAPAMLAALARADALLGERVPVTSGYRSPERQQALWDRRHSNPFPVARPGTSMHERGLAVDVPGAFVGRLLEVAPAVGLCRPLPATDPIHFELCGAR